MIVWERGGLRLEGRPRRNHPPSHRRVVRGLRVPQGLAGCYPDMARYSLGLAGWLLAALQRSLCVAGCRLGALQSRLGVAGSDLGSVTKASRRHRERSRERYKGISASPGTISVALQRHLGIAGSILDFAGNCLGGITKASRFCRKQSQHRRTVSGSGEDGAGNGANFWLGSRILIVNSRGLESARGSRVTPHSARPVCRVYSSQQ